MVHAHRVSFKYDSRMFKVIHSIEKAGIFHNILVLALWRDRDDLAAQESVSKHCQIVHIKPRFTESIKNKWGKLLRLIDWYQAVLVYMKNRDVKCVNCHSLPILPLCVLLKFIKKCRLVYEPHELETETSVSIGIRKFFARWLERILIRYTDEVCVVNDSIAHWYKEAYGLHRVWVVKNIPHRIENEPAPTGLLRHALGLSPHAQMYLYQGGLSHGRGIELLLNVFAQTNPSKQLVFMGFGQLTGLVKKFTEIYPNIHYHPAVRPKEIASYTVDADVGLSVIENVCLNHYLCLPNKFFEYMSCGVPSIVSDFPELGSVIDEFGSGWKVSPTEEKVLELINSISDEDIKRKKANALDARSKFGWDIEEKQLLELYKHLGYASYPEK